MGKSKKKRKTRSESLVESYQSIFAEFEKHGQDINKMLEKMRLSILQMLLDRHMTTTTSGDVFEL